MGFLARLFGGGSTKNVATVVEQNASTGAVEIRITATGATFDVMSNDVLEAVMNAYTKHSPRKGFSGQIAIVVSAASPESVRAELPRLKEKLRGVSLGAISQGMPSVRFAVQVEGDSAEVVSGADLLKAK
jgi:hypothetical protein